MRIPALQCLYAYRHSVQDLIKRLKYDRAEAFHLRFVDGYMWEEVADILNISYKKVKRLRVIILGIYADVIGYPDFW